jgi:hypothetical protein
MRGCCVLIALLSYPAHAVSLVELYSPGAQIVFINPNQVSSLRIPRSAKDFAAGTKCVVILSNGNIISSVETCQVVAKRLR